MAEGFLAEAKSEASGGDRYLINIHTEVDTLKADGNGAESEIEDRGHVPAETSRRMACDCSVVHWHDDEEGESLNIGRKTRSIPPGPDTRFRGNGLALKARNKELELDITADTPIPKWCGETMDNDLAVLGLIQEE